MIMLGKALKGWNDETMNFYLLCKIFDNYLTRELNEETTEEETKALLDMVKELRKAEKDINKQEGCFG